MALDLRAMAPADIDIANAVLVAAFGSASRKRELELYLPLQPDGWLLALWNGAPAGAAGIMNYGPTAYIGLVGVDPAHQRRGIAQAMMQRLLQWAAEHGNPVLLLDASPNGAPLYERLGFVDDELSLVFVSEAGAPRPPLSDRVEVLQPADLPALAAFDAPIFGADRHAVFAALLDEAPERAFVARDEAGRIGGYLFAQPATIGPWAARTPAVADALLRAALQLGYQAGPTVLAPGSNPDVRELLLRHGFSSNRALRHMRLGGAGPVGRRALLYGMASFAIG